MAAAIEAQLARLERLDAKVKQAPGQMGLDFTAPPPKAAGKGEGKPCGQGHISKDKTCRKGGAGAQKANPLAQAVAQVIAGGDREREGMLKRLREYGVQISKEEEDELTSGDLGDMLEAQELMAAQRRRSTPKAAAPAAPEKGADQPGKGMAGIKFPRTKADLDAARETWCDGYDIPGPEARRMGDATFIYVKHEWLPDNFGRTSFSGDNLREALSYLKDEGWSYMRPPAPEEPVLQNPGREDPGLAPKGKPAGITAQDVLSDDDQAKLAKQQRQERAAAGDQQGAAAWASAERQANRARLQAAQQRQGMAQTGLFGVEEFDDTMPLFRRSDAADPVAALVAEVLREGLPGAQVLDWERRRPGETTGRVVSEGLVYRFRCDSEGYGYRPGWNGVTEEQWELRSEGFLQARDPSMRLDFKGKRPKFQQQSTKRKCAKGYSCGRACISLNKECRVNPTSAVSKARLRQLEALAREGDPKAADAAQEVQLQRQKRAEELKGQRTRGQLEKMLKDPRVAEMVRTGKVPEAAAADDGKPLAGKVRTVSPDQIEVDPERFQYKMNASKSGEVGSLSGVKKWDDNLAGVISVWQDPADGRTYVVNGHNRLGLAKRLGAEEVTVRYLKAGNAKEARAIGAMQNIAEGAGKETDAAKFFRDTGVTTMEQVEAMGLPLRSGKAEKGLALAKLPQEMFDAVIQGDLRMRRAAVIGASGLSEEKMREVGKILRQRPGMTDETLQEYVEQLAVSERQSQTTLDVFGSREETVDTGLARAELTNGLKKALGREARLLATVSKSRQAVETLEEKGGNVINVEQSQEKAGEARSVLQVFDQMKNLSGPVKTALDQAAARVTAGEDRAKVARELREAVIEALDEELRRAGLRKEPSNEAPTMSMFDSLDGLIERVVELQQRLDAVAPAAGPQRKGKKCGGSYIPANRKCRKGEGSAAASPAAAPAAAPVRSRPNPSEPVRSRPNRPAAPQGGGAAEGEQMRSRLAELRQQAAALAGPRAREERESLQAKAQIGVGRVAKRFKEVARAAGQAIAKAFLGASGIAARRETEALMQQVLEGRQRQVEADRSEQAKARWKAEDEAIAAKPRGEWTNKQVSNEVENDGEGRLYGSLTEHVVQLGEPVRVKRSRWRRGKNPEPLIDQVRYQVELSAAGIESSQVAAAKKAGVDLRAPYLSRKSLSVTFGVGIGEESPDYDRVEYPPKVGRRLALEISRTVSEQIKDLPDGQLLTCSAWKDDGAGEARQKLYERAGFQFFDGEEGWAVVRNGKITRLETTAALAGRKDSGEEIDLEELIYGLLMVKPEGEEEE